MCSRFDCFAYVCLQQALPALTPIFTWIYNLLVLLSLLTTLSNIEISDYDLLDNDNWNNSFLAQS